MVKHTRVSKVVSPVLVQSYQKWFGSGYSNVYESDVLSHASTDFQQEDKIVYN